MRTERRYRTKNVDSMTNQDSRSDAHHRKVIQSVSDANRDASRSSKQEYAIVDPVRHTFAVFTICPLLQSYVVPAQRTFITQERPIACGDDSHPRNSGRWREKLKSGLTSYQSTLLDRQVAVATASMVLH